MFDDVVEFIQEIYKTKSFIPLHEPKFVGNEKQYLNECIDSTFVSSVGMFVDLFEEKITEYTGAKYAVASSSGTSALHISLLLADVQKDDEVITQSLNFVATCNAINYCGANPIFIDVDKDSMGMSPTSLLNFLESNTYIVNNQCKNKLTDKVIKACVPMHTYGHPCRVDKIKDICDKYHLILIEDAAESVGSFYKDKHTGTFGQIGTMSFNGNKIITAGGGGCIITNDAILAKKAKHLTTTAKVMHRWEFTHDMVGYNYRMPNINAALLVAQLENLNNFLGSKRKVADKYKSFFEKKSIDFVKEIDEAKSNCWLNSIVLDNLEQRDSFLEITILAGVMTRPVWTLMNKLSMFKDCQKDDLRNSKWLEERVVNIPSSVTAL
jgi:perosamine synthetase